MTTQNLVHMANQVAVFFSSYPEAEAILAEKAGSSLSHIALEAVKCIAQPDAAKKSA